MFLAAQIHLILKDIKSGCVESERRGGYRIDSYSHNCNVILLEIRKRGDFIHCLDLTVGLRQHRDIGVTLLMSGMLELELSEVFITHTRTTPTHNAVLTFHTFNKMHKPEG